MKKIYFLVFLLLAFQLFLLFNLKFTAWPEMLAYPYLRNHGFLLYKDMIHPYPPLLTIGLSFRYDLFGYELWVLKATAWGAALLSGFLVFLITKKLTGRNLPALFSLTAFSFSQPFLEGNMLWFDIAVIPPILLGLFFLFRNNIFLTGLFLTVAILIKQTAGLYLIFTILYLIFMQKLPLDKFKSLIYGPLLLGIPLLIRLAQEGALLDFINWTLVYPLTEWGKIIGYVQMELSMKDGMVVLLLFAPLIFVFTNSLKILKDSIFQVLFLFLIASLVAVYPRFSFFHFQTSLALVIILYGYLLPKIKINPYLLIFYFVLFALLVHMPALMRDFQKEVRFYGEEEKLLAQIITDKVSKEKKVYLLGLPSNLYVMADRLPPKRWTDNFPWYLEIPGIQEEIISRWSTNPPKYVFWRVPSPGNLFDLGTYQPNKIVQWIENNYSKREEVVPGVWFWQVKKDLP